jgi:cytochrome o ubiquinol oxidase subunit 2
VALDWKWLFIYPDLQVATVNQLIVPVGAPLEFVLTSATVMNAFFVPQLGSQIYTMPGMTSHLNLLAAQAGDYPGLSAHFSGEGFADMRFTVHALSRPEFDRWVQGTRADRPALSMNTYAQLSRPSSAVEPSAYGHVDAGLFEQVIHIAAPPGAAAPPAN